MDGQQIAILVLCVYMFAVLAAGGWFGRRAGSSGSSWQFGSKGLGVFSIVAVLLGTRLGATATVGLTEDIYNTGIVAMWFIISQGLGATLTGHTTGLILYRTRMMTLPALMLVRFGPRCVAAGILGDMIIGLAINGIQALGVGLIIQALTGLDLKWGIFIGSFLGWSYLTFGGLAATAATNLIHLLVCSVGVVLGMFLLFGQAPLGEVMQNVPAEKIDLFVSLPTIINWVIVYFAISVISNVFHTPLATARSEKDVLRASYLTTGLYLIIGSIVAVFGIYAIGYYGPLYEQNTGDPMPGNIAFGAIAKFLGDSEAGGSPFGGLVGLLMMSGVIGAIISTMAPLAWNISTLVSRDVYKKHVRPEASSGEELLVARVFSTVYWLIPGFIGLFISRDLLSALLFLLELPVGAAFAGFLMIYWDRVNEPSFFYSILMSWIAGIAHKLIDIFSPETLESLNSAMGSGLFAWWFSSAIGWIVTSSALVFFPLVFLGTPPTDAQLEPIRRARAGLEPLASAAGVRGEELAGS